MILLTCNTEVKAQNDNENEFVPKVGFTLNVDALLLSYISGSFEFPIIGKSGFIPVIGWGYWKQETGDESSGKFTYKIVSGSLGFKKFFNVKENVPKGAYIGASVGIFKWGIDYLEKGEDWWTLRSYEETGSASFTTFYGNLIMGYRAVWGERFMVNSEFGVTYLQFKDYTVKTTKTYENGKTETTEENGEGFKYKGFVPFINLSVGFLF